LASDCIVLPRIIESLLAALTALSHGSWDHFRWLVRLGF